MPRSKALYWSLPSAFASGCATGLRGTGVAGSAVTGFAGRPFFPFTAFLTATGLTAAGLDLTGGLIATFFAGFLVVWMGISLALGILWHCTRVMAALHGSNGGWT